MASSPMETGPQHEGGVNKLEEKEASPCKKQKAEPEGVLTLDMIREAMRAELSKNRDELGQAVATVREEVALFGKRVDSIEAGVTRQMEGTNKVLAIVTANHEKQTESGRVKDGRALNFWLDIRNDSVWQEPMGGLVAT